jgi:hypothetical protein
MKRAYVLIGATAALGFAVLLVWGFFAGRGEATAEAQSEQAIKPEVRLSPNPFGPPTLILNPGLRQQAGIETARPQTAPYSVQIRAYGSVLELQSFIDLGNMLAAAKAQRAIAEAKLAASRTAFDRTQTLYRDNQNLSRAELQAAEATFRSDEAAAHAAQVQAENAVASAYQAWGPVLGESLTANTSLAQELIQHKRLLIQVTLPLGVAPTLLESQPTASIETAMGRQIHIRFLSSAVRTDPRIQGASFFYTAIATTTLLSGMNVTVLLSAGQPVAGVAIPASAVVWLQGRAWVYLQTGQNAFTRQEISTAEPEPGGGYLVPTAPSSAPGAAAERFPTDKPLVAAGALVLLSQELSAQIQLGT